MSSAKCAENAKVRFSFFPVIWKIVNVPHRTIMKTQSALRIFTLLIMSNSLYKNFKNVSYICVRILVCVIIPFWLFFAFTRCSRFHCGRCSRMILSPAVLSTRLIYNGSDLKVAFYFSILAQMNKLKKMKLILNENLFFWHLFLYK